MNKFSHTHKYLYFAKDVCYWNTPF